VRQVGRAILARRRADGDEDRLGARYPVGGAKALVLQGALLGADGRRARPGERWHWPAGAALGTASPGEVELICAVRAGAAQA
jgi:hypothetical protein